MNQSRSLKEIVMRVPFPLISGSGIILNLTAL